MLASIVISNHNYGRYLAEAIDSALAQDYPDLEVLVVDDGSDDDSRAVIEAYRGRVTALYKSNGGQCSTINLGFGRSRGDAVIFLDADDVLLPHAVSRHVEQLRRGAVKSCGYMQVMDADGSLRRQRIPRRLPASGDYRRATLEDGIDCLQSSFTSGHAWSRWFLNRVLPLPADDRLGVDGYLTAIDRLFGPVAFVHEPVVHYRVHGSNKGPIRYRDDVDYLRERVRRKQLRIAFAECWARRLGYQVNERRFRRFRDWRLVLMQHAVAITDASATPVPLREYFSAPFRRRPLRASASSAAAACMLAIRLLPPRSALGLTRRVLKASFRRALLAVTLCSNYAATSLPPVPVA